MKNTRFNFLIIITLCAAVGLFAVSCDEEEIYAISPGEEIERYIDDSDIGKAFFADDQFPNSVTFTFPEDDAVYIQTFDSSRRSVTTLNLGTMLVLETGEYFFSNVKVTDWLYHSIHRELSGQVSQHSISERLERLGLLVKLGSDGQAYTGWLLQGYADTLGALNILALDGTRLWLDNVTPIIVSGTDLTLPQYRDSLEGRDYMDIDNVSEIESACQLEIASCEDCVTIAYYQTDAGFVAEVLPGEWPESGCYSDTATLGEGSSVVWTSLSLQTICKVNDSTFNSSIRYIPFKVNH